MARMNVDLIRQGILKAGENGRIFTVVYKKRTNGEERTMTCRLGVHKHLKGGELGYDPKQHNLIGVFEVNGGGYKMINLEGVQEIRSKHLWGK